MLFDDLRRIEKSIEKELSGKVMTPAQATSPFSVYGQLAPPRKMSEYIDSLRGWVYACVSVRADEVARANIRLYQAQGEDVNEITSHPILDLIYRPNPYMTKFDLMWLTSVYLDTTGEAPWFLYIENGKIRGIYLLRPDRLTPIGFDDPKGQQVLQKYRYQTLAGAFVDIDPQELIFIKNPDPSNPFRGMSIVKAAAVTIDIDDYAEQFNKSFFYNSARPDALMTSEKNLTDKQVKELKKQIGEMYSGYTNAHKVMVLAGGLDFKPLALSQKDMDFLAQQNFTRDKILALFRVPRTVLGLTDDVNRANAEATDYVFARRTVTPILERIFEQLNEFFVPLFSNTALFLDFDDVVPLDAERDSRIQSAQIANGIKTVNEVRSENGDAAVEGGDQLLVPFNLVPLGSPAVPLPAPAKGLRYAKGARIRGRETEDISEAILSEVLPEARRLVRKAHRRGQKQADILDNEAFIAEYVKAADKYEGLFRKKQMAFFERQKKKVLGKFPKKAPSDFLLDPADEGADADAFFTGLEIELALHQGTLAATKVGAVFTLSDDVKKWISERIFRFSFDAAEETNVKLQKVIQDSIEQGLSISDTRRQVSGLFDEMAGYRAERIARTEVIKTSNYAALMAYDQSGVVEGKRWIAVDSACEFCLEAEHKFNNVPLMENFLDKGDTFTGASGGKMVLDYEDIMQPPLHANCRCTIGAIIKK